MTAMPPWTNGRAGDRRGVQQRGLRVGDGGAATGLRRTSDSERLVRSSTQRTSSWLPTLGVRAFAPSWPVWR